MRSEGSTSYMSLVKDCFSIFNFFQIFVHFLQFYCLGLREEKVFFSTICCSNLLKKNILLLKHFEGASQVTRSANQEKIEKCYLASQTIHIYELIECAVNNYSSRRLFLNSYGAQNSLERVVFERKEIINLKLFFLNG